MPTVNVSLPTPLYEYLESRIARGESVDASEYVADLIRLDRERQQRRREFDDSLADALAEGSVPMSVRDWDDLREAVQKQADARVGS